MPTLHDLRTDFRKGRTGQALQSKVEARAYSNSLYDAQNMMVTSDGKLLRRWATIIKAKLAGGNSRLESWTYAETANARFLLVFSDEELTIYDEDLTERFNAGAPWDSDAIWFLTLSADKDQMIVTDTSFTTQLITFDADAGTFSMQDFAFDLSSDKSRLRAPFFQFVDDDTTCDLTILTSAGASTGYGSDIATASGNSAGDFDLAAGTGLMNTSADVFTADHVGGRIRVLDGELEVTAVNSATEAQVKVWRDIAAKLENDPFFVRNGSTLVEVAYFDHGLAVGDEVFFAGISSLGPIKDLLTSAVQFASDGTTSGGASGTPGTYTVSRIIDKDHFEIEGEGTPHNNDELVGGSDVLLFRFGGITGFEEPAFGFARGWPQAVGTDGSRTWLGGTELLPDAAWGSRPYLSRNFDPGEGDPDDAVTLYGIGQKARVRHIVPGFDLFILTDQGEFYVPGSRESTITQEAARAVTATPYGTSYTTPFVFDTGVYFVDPEGTNIREIAVRPDEQGYHSPPVSVVIPDWVKSPKDATRYSGSEAQATPYLVWSNMTDGAMIVMHSSRADDALGFMRWTIKDARVISAAGLGSRLFACVEWNGSAWLVEFDTVSDYATVDMAEKLSAGVERSQWVANHLASLTVQGESGTKAYAGLTIDAGGAFTLPEKVTDVTVGLPMSWSATPHAGRAASGQGPKVGKMQRLVSAEIHWEGTTTGMVGDETVISAFDAPVLSEPEPIDEWRQYFIGEWGREPRVALHGDEPGKVRIGALVLNVYF